MKRERDGFMSLRGLTAEKVLMGRQQGSLYSPELRGGGLQQGKRGILE